MTENELTNRIMVLAGFSPGNVAGWSCCLEIIRLVRNDDKSGEKQFLDSAAIAAMQGLVEWYMQQADINIESIAKDAWKIADYLLAERKKRMNTTPPA